VELMAFALADTWVMEATHRMGSRWPAYRGVDRHARTREEIRGSWRPGTGQFLAMLRWPQHSVE
jgi:hypothetical protein